MTKKMNDQAKKSKKELNCSCRRSYLLRMWCTDELRSFNWQASLEIPETGERIGFASLEELFAYLMDLTITYEQYARGELIRKKNSLMKHDTG